MNTIEIPERNITATYPSCWEEMTDQQFACVVQNWLKLYDGKLSVSEFYLVVLYNFLGIKRSPLQNWKDKRLSEEQLEEKFANVWQLTETLHWLLIIPEGSKSGLPALTFTDTTNHIPEIGNDGEIKLIGLANGMLDITFGEYRRAYAHFSAFNQDRKDIYLNRLIATLYLPERSNYEDLKNSPDFDGRRREKFNQNLTEHYAELLKRVPFWQKYSIFLWFFNCDVYLKNGELELDGKPISFEPLFRKTESEAEVESLDENDLGMTQLLYGIAESKLFGSIAEVDKTNYIDVLTALLYWKQQCDKLKK
jgi:hypothetical protein